MFFDQQSQSKQTLVSLELMLTRFREQKLRGILANSFRSMKILGKLIWHMLPLNQSVTVAFNKACHLNLKTIFIVTSAMLFMEF